MNTKKRCFVTIATGSDKYFILAVKLLHSFRLHSKDNTPFGIICDRENEYAKEFDFVSIMEDPEGSYMDKLKMYKYSDYEETIFIDADSLIMKDPSVLWDDFSAEGDVSAYGKYFPVENTEKGWFEYEHTGKYKKDVDYTVTLHGGAYYFRNTEKAASIFETAIEIAGDYAIYKFRGFQKPADEPVVALSLAVHKCRPHDKNYRIIFVHNMRDRIKTNKKGELFLDKKPAEAVICHFATKNTAGFLYKYLSARSEREYEIKTKGSSNIKASYMGTKFKTAKFEIKASTRHKIRKIARKIFSDKQISKMKKH